MESKTSPRHLNAMKRRRKAWDLRITGKSVGEIAIILKVSPSQASKDIAAAFEIYKSTYSETAAQASLLDLQRLDKLVDSHWANATSGQNIKASELVLKLLTQRERIHGYGKSMVAPAAQQDDTETLKAKLIEALYGQPAGNGVKIQQPENPPASPPIGQEPSV